VLSGAADPGHARLAMAAVNTQLIGRDPGLALLFAPPFDRTRHDPGYVKAYPPGLRENGGQYTHGALWSVMAFAALGQGDEASELFSLLNPVNHTRTRTDVHRYKVEPYVVAADVYSVAPHRGRGGWTWYTGSAGWMYRAGIESILGVRLQGPKLLLAPCIPVSWPRAEVSIRHRSTRYDIVIENPQGVSRGIVRVELDGATLAPGVECVDLVDDGGAHQVRLVLGKRS
jgi:cyclic beta-1,2-glucan synthetase